jgi:methylenetetrahydrofolate dehydrogenase (NADP+)/methenyltetrahydrofolate cyclohydrolase
VTTSATLIDGKRFAGELRAHVAERTATFRTAHGFAPGLAVVLVGDDAASSIYVRRKREQCDAVGMKSFAHLLPANTSEADLLALIERLNRDPAVHGILVQLPLPQQIDTQRVISAVHPDKDIDGFHVVNAGKLALGEPGLAPCTPRGCIIMLRETLGSLRGKRALVVGRSVIVGRPMAQLLLIEDCTVTIAHRHSLDLPDLCRAADIIIVAVGIAELIRGDWIRPGATVIDVGINRVPDPDRPGTTRIVGDVAFAEARHVAGAITPVPGGVGPMTIACLLQNTLDAAEAIMSRAGMGSANAR